MDKNKLFRINVLGVILICFFLLNACSQDASELLQQMKDSQTKAETIEYTEVVLEEAGTLDSILGDRKATLKSMRLKGPMNAVDVKCMQGMTALRNLDMKEVCIIGGSEKYYNDYILEDDKIGPYMFKYLGLNSIILPDGIIEIGDYALSEQKISSIDIPDGVKIIAYAAFFDCKLLVSANLPSELKIIEARLFERCYKLETVNIPDNLEIIRHYAFSQSGLKSIVIPNSVHTIEYSAFSFCSQLSEIRLPANLKKIEADLFYKTEKLETIDMPESVEMIEQAAFYGSGLKSISLSSNLVSIGQAVFAGTGIQQIKIPDKVTSMGEQCFFNCGALVSCKLSANLKYIPDRMFENCSKLASLDIHNMVESIGEYAFVSCVSLPSLKIPESVKTIRSNAFYQCVSLSSMIIPEGVERLGERLFDDCRNLRSVTIPSTVVSIENPVLGSGLENLTFIFWNSPANCNQMAIPKNCLVYVSSNATMPIDWKTKVIKGEADEIVLTDGMPFDCPQEFFTRKISFKRKFSMETGNGEAAGWETISLPFEPTTIKDKDGNILAPFGSDVKNAKYFWLRELTAEGFKDATKIEANKPYIIAMPNHPAYNAQYIIEGDVTFEAQNVTVKVSSSALKVLQGPEFSMTPVYCTQQKANFAYALNKNNELDSKPGSIFISGLRDVLPFEAYITPNRSTQSADMIRIQGPVRTKSIGNVPLKDRM